MPFTKKSKPKVEKETLPKALGIEEDRADTIADEVHDLLHETAEDLDEVYRLNNAEFLLALHDKYNDHELVYAIYVGSRMIERHTSQLGEEMADLLKLLLKK